MSLSLSTVSLNVKLPTYYPTAPFSMRPPDRPANPFIHQRDETAFGAWEMGLGKCGRTHWALTA